MPKTSCSSSSRRSSSANTPPADVNGHSVEQLARLPAEVLHLHLASRHLVTSGPKATMAKRLYDAVNPSTINNGDNVSRSQVAPPPSTFSGNTSPSTNQLTATNTTLPPAALQAQLSSLMAQFLQYATPSASTSHEAPVTCLLPPRSTTLNSPRYQLLLPAIFPPSPFPLDQPPLQLQPASLRLRIKPHRYQLPLLSTYRHRTYGQWSSHSSRPKLFGYSTAADTCSIAPSYACHWLDHASTALPPIDNTAYSPPNGHRHLTTRTCSNTPKIIQGEFIDFSVLLHRATFPDATADPLPSTQQPIKKISYFVMWMQAWNLYLSVILSNNPAKVLEMIPYQRLICSATTLLPLKSWLQYNAKFCTLAAANPLLRWDQRHQISG